MIFPPNPNCNKCIVPLEPGDIPFCCLECHQRGLLKRAERTKAVIKSLKAELKIKGRMYFITLTNPDKDPTQLIKRWCRFSHSSGITVKHNSLELTESGLPHIHALIETDKYLDYRRVLSANRGNRVDIQKCKFESECADYINKDRTKPSAEWIETWGKQYRTFINNL